MTHNDNKHQREIIKKWLGTGSINIFGPPYAGKDTQGNFLVETFNTAPLIGGGDILRNSVIPEHAKKLMERGELFPTEEFVAIVLPYLSQKSFADKALILSAVGRWWGEEKGVLKVTTQSNHTLKAVVCVTLSEKLIWQRWETHKQLGNRGARRDDKRESLEIRLKEFREKSLPVIDFYRNMGILIEVDGNQPLEKVFDDIINGLYKFAQNSRS